MSITVVGSVAYDSIETPAGRRERCLGGAATYFSLSASFFTDVRVIAVVGEDFGPEQEAVFKARNIDTRGIEHTAGQKLLLGRLLSRKPERSQDSQHRAERLRIFRAKDSRRLSRLRISLPRQHRSRAAAPRSRSDARRQARGRRHHELLDQGSSPGAARSSQRSRHSAHQRH